MALPGDEGEQAELVPAAESIVCNGDVDGDCESCRGGGEVSKPWLEDELSMCGSLRKNHHVTFALSVCMLFVAIFTLAVSLAESSSGEADGQLIAVSDARIQYLGRFDTSSVNLSCAAGT